MTSPTTPRDAIGLSERLRDYRVWSATHGRYNAVELTIEAATQIDALTAERDELRLQFDQTIKEFGLRNDELAAAESRATRAEQERDEAMAALRSTSTQCGNVIFNCEQRPSDNERHLSSWRGVKEFLDAAIRRLSAGPEKEKRE